MANALGIDVGEIYRTVEAVKASRAHRELEAAKHQNALATQAATAEAAAGAGQNPASMAKLIAINPAAAKQLTEVYSSLNEEERKTRRDQLEQVGSMAAGILSSGDPASAYKQARASMDPALAETMPPEYSEDWVKVQLARATEADKLFDAIDGERVAERDLNNKLVLQDDAQAATAAEGEKDRANALAVKADEREFQLNRDASAFKNDLVKIEAKAKAEGLGKVQVESKDSSLLYKQALELLGGVFDQAGNLQVTDPNIRSKGQEIAVRASKLFLEGAPSHAEAVKLAAQELGISFPGSASADGKNTGNLTGDFLNILGQ